MDANVASALHEFTDNRRVPPLVRRRRRQSRVLHIARIAALAAVGTLAAIGALAIIVMILNAREPYGGPLEA